MPTPKQLYSQKLDDIARRYVAMEDATIREMIVFFRQFRAQLAEQLTMAEGWNAFQLRELQANIGRLVAQMESQLGRLLTQNVGQSANMGGASVVEPLRELGFESVFFQPSIAQVNTLLDFSADLVRGIGSETLQKINTQIRLSALGNQTPFEAMKGVSRILGISDLDELRGVAYRSERIIRTELQRTFNLSTHSQQQATAQQIPDLMKGWIATGDKRTRDSHLLAHIRYRKNPIPVSEPFIVGGVKMMFPLDPSAPARETINCRCRMRTVHPDIGVIGSTLDARIAKEIGRRKNEKERSQEAQLLLDDETRLELRKRVMDIRINN